MPNQKGLAPILIVIVIALVVGSYFIYTNYSQDRTKVPTQTNFDVVVKENNTDKAKSDIYLKDKNGKETLFITITDVYRGHYYNSEFKNGNLYIIRRTGGEEGYQNIPDWTDELWKYNSSKKGTKLYSIRGLDFRVSKDDKLIAIVGIGPNNTFNLAFIDTNGNEIKKYSADDIGISNFGPFFWGENAFWVKEAPLPSFFVKIDTISYQLTKFDVSDIGMGVEYAINPAGQKLAYSNYPPLFDVDSVEEFKQSGKKVTLTVYDLETGEEEQIATSTTKEFNPKWIDDDTLEYDNPKGEGRVQNPIKSQ